MAGSRCDQSRRSNRNHLLGTRQLASGAYPYGPRRRWRERSSADHTAAGLARLVVREASAIAAYVAPVKIRLTPSSRPVTQRAVAGRPISKMTPTIMLQIPAAATHPQPDIGLTFTANSSLSAPSAMNRVAIITARANAP